MQNQYLHSMLAVISNYKLSLRIYWDFPLHSNAMHSKLSEACYDTDILVYAIKI